MKIINNIIDIDIGINWLVTYKKVINNNDKYCISIEKLPSRIINDIINTDISIKW